MSTQPVMWCGTAAATTHSRGHDRSHRRHQAGRGCGKIGPIAPSAFAFRSPIAA